MKKIIISVVSILFVFNVILYNIPIDKLHYVEPIIGWGSTIGFFYGFYKLWHGATRREEK